MCVYCNCILYVHCMCVYCMYTLCVYSMYTVCVYTVIVYCIMNIFERYALLQLVEELRYQPEGREFDSRRDRLYFSLTCSFRPQYAPKFDSASNRNE